MFYATKQDKYIVEGTAFELDGIQYPAVWLNQATAEQKAEARLREPAPSTRGPEWTYLWCIGCHASGIAE